MRSTVTWWWSGRAAPGFAPRSALANALTDAGFVIDETVSYARGYSTPHILFTAHAR